MIRHPVVRLSLAVCAALALVGCSATAERPAPVAATAGAAAPVVGPDGAVLSQKVVCVNERVTGSRHPTKVCHTTEEWTLIKESGRNATRDVQRLHALPREGG